MKFRMFLIHCAEILLAAALVVFSAGAKKAPSSQSELTLPDIAYSIESDVSQYPLNPPNTSSPQATMWHFLDKMNRSYRIIMEAHRQNTQSPGFFTPESLKTAEKQAKELFVRAVYCLDLSRIPASLREDMGFEAALLLKEILDRVELPPTEQIPDANAVDVDREQRKFPIYDRWCIPFTSIFITRIEEGPREGEYLFASETVARLNEFYKEVKNLPYKSDASVSPGFYEFCISTPGDLLPPKWSTRLPAWSNYMYLDQTLWQWGFTFFVFILAILLIRIMYRVLLGKAAVFSLAKRYWRWVIFALFANVMNIILYIILEEYINLTGAVIIVLRTIVGLISTFLLALAAFMASRGLAETIAASPKIDPKGVRAAYYRALFGVIGIIAAAIIIIIGLSRVGVALTPLLTGVGIGGFAIALAARPTLENIIGSFTIFADKPYNVGQRVNILGQDGTIESIGLRSTRIRLLSGHLTSIPNEKMASVEIENIGMRPNIRRMINITIPYDTPVDKVKRAVEILREILAVPKAEPDSASDGQIEHKPHPNEAINQPDFPPRVYFNNFNPDSLNLFVIYWYYPPDYWWDYMEHTHWINMQIMERFNAEGIEFAFPTQTLHLAGDDKRPLNVGQRPIS